MANKGAFISLQPDGETSTKVVCLLDRIHLDWSVGEALYAADSAVVSAALYEERAQEEPVSWIYLTSSHSEELSPTLYVDRGEVVQSVIHGPPGSSTPLVSQVEWLALPEQTLRIKFFSPTNGPYLGDAAALNTALSWEDGKISFTSGRGAWSEDNSVLTISGVDIASWATIVSAIDSGNIKVRLRELRLLSLLPDDAGTHSVTSGPSRPDELPANAAAAASVPSGYVGGRVILRLVKPGSYTARLFVGGQKVAETAAPLELQLCAHDVLVGSDGVALPLSAAPMLTEAVAAASAPTFASIVHFGSGIDVGSEAGASVLRPALPKPVYRLSGAVALTGTRALRVPNSVFVPTDTAPGAGAAALAAPFRPWSMCFWWMLLEGPTGKHRAVFFKGPGGDSHHRTPSAWLEPLSNLLALRVSADGVGNADVGGQSTIPLEVGRWTHLCFAFEAISSGGSSGGGSDSSSHDSGGSDGSEASEPVFDGATWFKEGPRSGKDSVLRRDNEEAAEPAINSDSQQPSEFRYSVFVNGALDTALLISGAEVLANDAPIWFGVCPFGKGPRALLSQLSIWADTVLRLDQARALCETGKPLFLPLGQNAPAATADLFKGDGAPQAPALAEAAAAGSCDTLHSDPLAFGAFAAAHSELRRQPQATQAPAAAALVALSSTSVGMGLLRGRIDAESGAGSPAATLAASALAEARSATEQCLSFRHRLEAYKMAAMAGSSEAHLAVARLLLGGSEGWPHQGANCPRDDNSKSRSGHGSGSVRLTATRTHLEQAVALNNADAAFLLSVLAFSGLVPPTAQSDSKTLDSWALRRVRERRGELCTSETRLLLPIPPGAAVGDEMFKDCGDKLGQTAPAAATAWAMALLHVAALGGSSEAQMALGWRYLEGYGAEKDAEASAWYLEAATAAASAAFHTTGAQTQHEMDRLAESKETEVEKAQRGEDDEQLQYQMMRAEQGDVNSLMSMGQLYYWGQRGMPRDQARARTYFARAASLGSNAGRTAAANMLLRGEGGPHDHAGAVALYEAAAAEGDPNALNGLAYEHFFGHVLPVNYTKAFSYFLQASQNGGFGDSFYNAGHCLANGQGVERDVPRALELFIEGSNRFGHFDCSYSAGTILIMGDGVPRDAQRASDLLLKSAAWGPWGGIVRAGFDCYLAKDYQCALHAYAEAAELGYEAAASNAAYLLDRGLVPRGDASAALPEPILASSQAHLSSPAENLTADKEQWEQEMALRWHVYAALHGNTPSFVALGDGFYYGSGSFRQDYVRAAFWYNRAAAAGVAKGAYNMAYLYENGFGVRRDFKRALELYAKVASAADAPDGAPAKLLLWLVSARVRVGSWLAGDGQAGSGGGGGGGGRELLPLWAKRILQPNGMNNEGLGGEQWSPTLLLPTAVQRWVTSARAAAPAALDGEVWAMIALGTALAGVLGIRSWRRRRRQRRRMAERTAAAETAAAIAGR